MTARLPRMIAGAALACGCSAGFADDTCQAALATHLDTDLQLEFSAFDQTEGKGWRALSAAGCDLEAAALISQYIARRDKPHPVLQWHLAQTLARADRRDAAIAAARLTLRPTPSSPGAPDFGVHWNDYVRGTIAFLDNDREALDSSLRALAQDNPGASELARTANGRNAAVLRRLRGCFGQPYAAALDCAPAAPQ